MEGPCPVCGASWECEHRVDPERDRLRYISPDGPTLGEYQRDPFQQAAAVVGIFREVLQVIREPIVAAAEAIERFTAIYDALPAATKEEMRRLDASP